MKYKGCFQSLRKLIAEGVLSAERDCFFGPKRRILRHVLTFQFRRPPDRSRWECMFYQSHLSCSGRSGRERSLQVSRIDPGVADMPTSHRSWIQEDLGGCI